MVRVRFLKSIASIYGGFAPGMVADIPNGNTAASWCRAGICEEAPKAQLNTDARLARHLARVEEYKGTRKSDKTEPDNIPDGQFWCEKHSTLHKKASPTGYKCLRRIEKEAEAAKVAEAEEETRISEEARVAEEERIAGEERVASLAEDTGGSEEPGGEGEGEGEGEGPGSLDEGPYL